MNYEEYELNDFLLDDYFIQWVKHPDAQNDLFWKAWIARHPEKKSMIEEAKYILSSIQFEDDSLSEQEVADMWKDIRPMDRPIPQKSRQKSLDTSSAFPWRRMAAVFVGILFLASLSLWIMKWQSLEQESKVQYTTAYGQTKTIMLPDSSEVILNANSSLSFSSEWSSDSIRQVWLNGEAFFSVVHLKKDQKFIVHSKGIDIKVLGTEFNVNNRREKVRVVLNRGKVTLEDQHDDVDEEIVMKPGELVEIEKGKKAYSRKAVKTELYTSWKKNKLVFDGTPIAEIAQLLEDNYGYQVSIEDSLLAQRQFKGTVSTNEINKLLDQIAKVFNANIQVNGQQISIEPQEH